MYDTLTGYYTHVRLWACVRRYAITVLAKPPLHRCKFVASEKTRIFMGVWLVVVKVGVYDCLGGIAGWRYCNRCAVRVQGHVSNVGRYVEHQRSQDYVTYGFDSAVTVLGHTR